MFNPISKINTIIPVVIPLCTVNVDKADLIKQILKAFQNWMVVAHTFNPSIWETEGSLEVKTSLVSRISSRTARETLSQEKKRKTKQLKTPK